MQIATNMISDLKRLVKAIKYFQVFLHNMRCLLVFQKSVYLETAAI